MTSRDFCFWLQGFFEITEEAGMNVKQADIIKAHLAMVFVHEIDPSMGKPAHQSALNDLHGKPTIGGQIQTPNGPVLYRC